MASLPAHNPPVPFSSYIPGGVNVGTKILIRGMVPYTGNCFTIDLQCGEEWVQDDIAFHLNVRPSEYTIVRNSFQYYNWGPEERHGSSPIARGYPYDIEISVGYDRFSVRVNGTHFCDFQHRVAFQRISHIRINGDTVLYYVGQEGYSQTGYLPPPPPYQSVVYTTNVPIVVAQPPRRRPLFRTAFPGGLLGMALLSRPGHYHHHHHYRHHEARTRALIRWSGCQHLTTAGYEFPLVPRKLGKLNQACEVEKSSCAIPN